MNKIDINEIDFSKLNKLDVESSENTVYLDDKNEKIYIGSPLHLPAGNCRTDVYLCGTAVFDRKCNPYIRYRLFGK